MKSLVIIEAFKQIMKTEYDLFLNTKFFGKLIESIKRDGIQDISNILLHGPDSMILDVCLEILLLTMTTSSPPVTREPNNIHKFPHQWHMQYIIVDAIVLLSEDRTHLVNHLRLMMSQHCMDPLAKHIIVIKNTQSLTQNMTFALRSIIENPKCTCLFIFTCTNITKMDVSLITRCMPIKCCVNANSCSQHIIKRLKLDIMPDFLVKSLDKSKGNISKFLVILERHQSKNGATMFLFDSFLETHVIKLVAAYQNPITFIKVVESTATQLEMSGVRPEAICNALVEVCQKIKPNVDMSNVIRLLVDIQMKIMLSNKYSYCLEELLHKLVVILRTT